MLTGFRGAPAVDLASLVLWVERLSQMMVNHPQILEVEMNPLIVNPKGRPSGVVDARVRIAGPANPAVD